MLEKVLDNDDKDFEDLIYSRKNTPGDPTKI